MKVFHTGYLGAVVEVGEVESYFSCSILPQYLDHDGWFGTVVSIDIVQELKEQTSQQLS